MADQNTSGAPTTGLGQQVTFGFKLRQPGQAQGMQYQPAAPADVMPVPRAGQVETLQVDRSPSPLVTALTNVAGNMAAEGLKEAQQNLQAKGMQAAMAGKAVEDIERERPLLARLFGEGDAAEGARVYGAQNAATQALMLIDRGAEENAALDPDQARAKFLEAGRAISTGDRRTDQLAQDLFFKSLPSRFEKHANMRVRYMQAKAAAAQQGAMTTAVASLSGSLKTAAANADLDLPDSAKNELVAGVAQTIASMAPAPGQNMDTYRQSLSNTLKHAAAEGDLHAVNALVANGLGRYLTADQLESVTIDVGKAEKLAESRFRMENRWQIAAFETHDPRDGFTTEQRMQWLEKSGRDYMRATGSRNPWFTAEQFTAYAKGSEEDIRKARQQDVDQRMRNAELALRAEANLLKREEVNAATEERNAQRAETAANKLAEKQKQESAFSLLNDDPTLAPDLVGRGIVSRADAQSVISARIQGMMRDKAPGLDSYIKLAGSTGYRDRQLEAHTQATPLAIMTDPEYGKDRNNEDNILVAANAYRETKIRLGDKLANEYYGDTAPFMQALSDSLDARANPLQAIKDAHRVVADKAMPDAKQALTKKVAETLASGRHVWYGIGGSPVPSMNATSAAQVAGVIARHPSVVSAEESKKDEAALDLMINFAANHEDTSIQRVEQAGELAWVLDPGQPSLKSYLAKDTVIAKDRTADVVNSVVNAVLYEGVRAMVPKAGLFGREDMHSLRVDVAPQGNGQAPLLMVSAHVKGYGPVTRSIPFDKVAAYYSRKSAEETKRARTPALTGFEGTDPVERARARADSLERAINEE